MRALIQRVTRASVTVEGTVIGRIEHGLLVFLGVGANDSEADCLRLADKITTLRIFSDENDKINLSLKDIDGEMLIVSQFTLYADCRKGHRPSFTQAAKPDDANRLYERFIALCSERCRKVEHGSFGADMKVDLLNDGPFTVMLD